MSMIYLLLATYEEPILPKLLINVLAKSVPCQIKNYTHSICRKCMQKYLFNTPQKHPYN